MQEVFEKIIEQLEELKKAEIERDDLCDEEGFGDGEEIYEDGKSQGRFEQVVRIIEIVKQEAEKYNNGWISCSERLPEIRQDCLVTVRYTGFMGMHGFWVKTGHMESENDWWGDCSGGEVIAWQPLHEPYQPKGE